MLLQLLYVSGAVRPMTDMDIADILTVSRRNNAERGITGIMLYRDSVFLQVLEGSPHNVRALYERISRDRRHRNPMIMMEREAGERAFGEWSMGFDYLPVHSREDQRSFELSRSALESRIAPVEAGIVLDTVLAFAERDFLSER